jgi:hypothetical protein
MTESIEEFGEMVASAKLAGLVDEQRAMLRECAEWLQVLLESDELPPKGVRDLAAFIEKVADAGAVPSPLPVHRLACCSCETVAELPEVGRGDGTVSLKNVQGWVLAEGTWMCPKCAGNKSGDVK